MLEFVDPSKLRNQTLAIPGSARRVLGLSALLSSACYAGAAHAQDAQWRAAPASNIYNNAGNWTPASVPTGTATFDASTTTSIKVDSSTSIGTLHFNAGAPQYTFSVENAGTVLTLNGAGIVNDSANRPLIVIHQLTGAVGSGSAVDFTGNSSASNTSFQVGDTNLGQSLLALGILSFHNSSSAGTSLINVTASGLAGFNDSTTAAASSITNHGDLGFGGQSQAGTASITNYGAMTLNSTAALANASVSNSNGYIDFFGQATAGNATITTDPGAFRSDTAQLIEADTLIGNESNNSPNNSGQILFGGNSTAGQAHLINNAGNAAYIPPTIASCPCGLQLQNSTLNYFYGSATAGSSAITNNGGLSGSFLNITYVDFAIPGTTLTISHQLTLTGNNAAVTVFNDVATAGSATIVNNNGAWTAFVGTATAANATITANNGATIWLRDQSSGGAASLIANNGATIGLFDTATAGAATVTGNSGAGIFFHDQTSGGTARFIDNAGARIDISGLTAPGTQVGSIEGGGNVFLGSRVLTIGGNNMSTTIGGVIANGGANGGTGGGVVKTGSGTLTLTGVDTYTGATTINQGALIVSGSLASPSVQVNAGGTLGGGGSIAGTVTIADGGIVAPGNSPGTLSVNNLLLSPGSILNYQLGPPGVIGGGVNDLIVVNGNLTLDGILNVTNAGGFGNGVYRLINYGGALTNNGLAIGSVPTTSDLLIQAGAGVVNLVVGAAGPTQFWDGADVTGNGTIDGGTGTWTVGPTNWTNAGGSLNSAWGGRFAVFQGVAGTVTVIGPIDFTGMQFLTGGYRVAPGTNAVLNLVGAVAPIRVDAGLVAEIAVPIAGTGLIDKADPGTLILSGANTYSGGTRIDGGTLQIGAGGTSGSVVGAIQDNAALAFSRSDTYDFTGTISGSGTVTQSGAGTLRFGTTQTYSGTTTVAAGTLQIDGSILSSALSVGANGTLTGTGSVGSTTVAGRISPAGLAAGTLTVSGNYVQLAGSNYAVTLPATGAGDLIRVNGTATLQGGTVQVANVAGAPVNIGTRTTILTAAGGRTGAFAGLTVAAPLSQPFLTFGLGYTATDAFLEVQRNNVAFASAGGTLNEIDAATGVDGLPSQAPLSVAVAGLADLAAARSAFDLVSGEIHASARGVLLDESRYVREAALGRTAAAGATGTAIWGQATGAWGRADGGGTGGAAPLTRSAQAVLVGLDGGFAGWRVGVFGGYSHSKINVARRASTASVDSYHLGAYGGASWGSTALRLGGAYSWHNLSTRRTAAFAGFGDTDNGDYGGHALQLFGELGQRFELGLVHVEPFAALAHVRLTTDAFAESGGAAALTGRKQSANATFSSLGLRGSVGIGALGTGVSLRASAAWRHAFNETVPTAQLAFGAGTPFTIYGAPIAREAVALEAGLELHLLGAGMLSLGYSGQFAGHTSDHGAQARLSIPF